ncbi:hypothetical protein [Paenibacillus aquistagni]|uniref:Uncharacterized protein n=1 Tax=Paenibacillus aquistagni TaxID=1852522 RepID=A0A1X7LS49_9BACL|nr:hypothetical protein [Paenibacillus aquistagni]SMG56307.1 hypothetical protein SAMN06295960_4100 [Paenibacillus aquistagni]
MTEKFKQNKGNKYAHQQKHAEAVVTKNLKHPGEKNPWESGRR